MGSHLLGSEEEPYYDEICSALGRFLSCSSGEFSSPEKTEPEREHKVLHGEQCHRLSSLGRRPWGWHSVLCQPGVQPVQGRQPRRHQGGNKGTNTRFFLGNNNPVGNGLVGFLGGFGTAAVPHSLLGNPCG